ncbi:MAG: hypothetical protein ABH871_04175 [Pseudomonadota bacterium]
MRVIEDRQPIWPYILLSFVLHALLIIIFSQFTSPLTNLAEKTIEVVPVYEVPEGRAKYKIADIAEPEVEKKPDKPKFLGMYDTSVREETVGIGTKPGRAGGEKKKQVKAKAERKTRVRKRSSHLMKVFLKAAKHKQTATLPKVRQTPWMISIQTSKGAFTPISMCCAIRMWSISYV